LQVAACDASNLLAKDISNMATAMLYLSDDELLSLGVNEKMMLSSFSTNLLG